MDEQKTERIVDDFTRGVENLKTGRGFWDVYEDLIKAHVKLVESDNTSAQVRDDYRKYNKEFYEVDPDGKSESLNAKHQKIWSKELPNNEVMSLDVVDEGDRYVVKWKDKNIRLGSDTIFTTFIAYKWKEKSSDMFKNEIKNVKELYCNFGGFAIFPVTDNSFNQVRGWGWGLADRFDLALECIRLYYKNKKDENKLTKQEKGFIERHKDLFIKLFEVVDKDSRKINQEFFDLFRDFNGYVDFFCFQDWVSDDYAHVKDLMRGGFLDDDGNISFEHLFPQSVTEYEQWMENQLKLVKARTQRINQSITEKN